MNQVQISTAIYVWGADGLKGFSVSPNSVEMPDLHVIRFSPDAYVCIRDDDAFREFARKVNEYAAQLPTAVGAPSSSGGSETLAGATYPADSNEAVA